MPTALAQSYIEYDCIHDQRLAIDDIISKHYNESSPCHFPREPSRVEGTHSPEAQLHCRANISHKVDIPMIASAHMGH